MPSKNNTSVEGARKVSLQMRDEIAKELGIYEKLVNAPETLTTREAGALGGNITRSLVKDALKRAKEGHSIQVDVDQDNKEMINNTHYLQ